MHLRHDNINMRISFCRNEAKLKQEARQKGINSDISIYEDRLYSLSTNLPGL